MPVGFYADVHVPGPIMHQLRCRGVSVLAATEEGTREFVDHELLKVSTECRRVMVTQDIRFKVMAEEWQRTGREFAGLIFAHPRQVGYGEMLQDLSLIAEATDEAYWRNRVEQLPL